MSTTTPTFPQVASRAAGKPAGSRTQKVTSLPDLTTTVLTMTLTGLAAESPLGGGNGAGTIRRLAASGSLLAGALAGALLTKVNLAAALAVAAAAVAISAVAYASRKVHS